MAYRAMGAAVFDAGMYEDIEGDRRATLQSAAIVILSSVAAALGLTGWFGFAWGRVALFALIALAAWTAWAALILQIGGRYLPQPQTRVDYRELLRTLGFASAPGLFQVVGIMPSVTSLVFVISGIWMTAAMVVAVKHALDFTSWWRAFLVCVLALSVPLALVVISGVLFGSRVS
jgi:hypothetical protein